MNNTQALQQTIHNYCLQLLSVGDFNKNQQVQEQLKKFIFDWNNLPILKQIIEIDCKPETTFVIYQLLQKSVASGNKFVNVLPCTQRTHSNIEELENYEKAFYTTIIQGHLDIIINYFQKGLKHPNYVQNTVLFSAAYIMRKYWCEILNIDQFIEKLINTFFQYQNTQIIQIGCKLFENLLNCVRQYYFATGYLEFRKVMLGFQRQSLSLLLLSSHNLLINQLQGRTFLQLYSIDQGFADSVISLLNSFMGFNFNLSFYEIDVDNDQKENNIINFPDSYFALLNDNKLTAEYFRAIIEFYTIDSNISLKLLTVVQRMASLRLSLFYGKRGHKKLVRRTLWEGLLFMLNNHQLYIMNSDFCNEICLFAIRLVFNFTLKKLHKFSDIFELVINQLNSMNQLILLKQGLKLSYNSIYIKMQELWNQLITQVNNYKSSFPLQLERLQNYIKISFRVLIQAFYDQNPFDDVPENLPIKKIKKFLDKSFKLCAQLYHQNCEEYTAFLSELLQKLPIQQLDAQIPVNTTHILQKLSNLFCLVSALVLSQKESELLQGYDYHGQIQEVERPKSVKDLVNAFFQVITFVNGKYFQSDEKIVKMFHASQLIFIQTYLQQTIENLQFDESNRVVISKSALQQINIYLSGLNNQPKWRIQFPIKTTLLSLNNVQINAFKYLHSETHNQLNIVLQFFNLLMKKSKDKLIEDFFAKFFTQMEVTCFNDPLYIKKRRQVYKLVALVWVDDFLDDYIPSLVDIYKQIKSSITGEINKINMLKYIWDMIGVIDELEVDGIYRVFLRIVFPDLAELLSSKNTQTFVQDEDCSIGLTSLLCSIFQNKNTRLQNENIQLLLYQLYRKAAFYFISSIDYVILQAQTSQQQNSQISDMKLKMVAKLLKVMGQISASRQINQGFFIIYQDTTYLTLFQKQLKLITVFRPYFQNLIKYKKHMFECLEAVCSEQSEALAYRFGPDAYHELLQICDQTIKDILDLKQLKGEEQINDEAIQLNQIANILVNVMQFFIQEAIIGEEIDTKMIKNKISEVYQLSKQTLQTIFKNAFTISVAFNKILKFQGSISDILYAISLFNPLEFQQILVQLIQEYKGTLTLSSLVLDPIQLAYKAFESYLNSTTKENYTKQVRYVLESIYMDKDF